MKIVIVEDEAPIRRGLSGIVSKIDADYTLLGAASNGLEGLELIEKTRPDVIIMDIQMPDLDGLTMLERLREKGIESRAIVLTAYSDFKYARKAIELGIENYLLKPIKIPELKKTLKQVEEKLKKENAQTEKYTLDKVMMEGMTGQLTITPEMTAFLADTYGFHLDRLMYAFMIHMVDGQENRLEEVKKALAGVQAENGGTFSGHVVEIPSRRLVIMILYNVKDVKPAQRCLETRVVRVLGAGIICVWGQIPDMTKLHLVLQEMEQNLSWNLLLEGGVIISLDKIQHLKVLPFLYPKELENRAKNALINRQPIEFGECVKAFQEKCQETLHMPKDIKEACIRFCIGIMNAARQYGYTEELMEEDILQTIARAVNWEQIDRGLEQMFRKILLTQSARTTPASTLIQKANKIIAEEYHTGLTLEELAGKLYVSEEYLSAQFKKETGKTFTETIRSIRMKKVRELLRGSGLKLNQIAEMVGYTDPKYMSRVFKEEEGILPAEYRKMHTLE